MKLMRTKIDGEVYIKLSDLVSLLNAYTNKKVLLEYLERMLLFQRFIK